MTKIAGNWQLAEMIRGSGVSHGFFAPAVVMARLGCVGLRAARRSEFRETLAHALALGQPVVIDAVTDETAMAGRAWVPASGGAHA